MTKKDKKIKDFLSEIKTQNDSECYTQDLTGSYLFISYDLSDSTQFKLIHKKWIEVFSLFYNYINTNIKDFVSSLREIYKNLDIQINEWKKIGDEILFYHPIVDIKLLPHIVKKIYSILNDLVKLLEKKYKPYISAKATTWLAHVKHYKDKDEKEKETNFIKNNTSNYNYLIYNMEKNELDFLGPDVDAGFRIAKYSVPNKLTLCAKLTYILLNEREIDDKDINNNIYIVSYKKLKGIWENRYYPIIWYFENPNKPNNKKIYDCFCYDEKFKNKIVKNFLNNLDKKLSNQNNNKKNIKKIFCDLNLEKEIKQIKSFIIKYNENKPNNRIITYLSALKRVKQYLDKKSK